MGNRPHWTTSPRQRGQMRFVVVAVDYFTKWAEAEGLATTTKKKITNFIWKNIIYRFGIPNAMVTNNKNSLTMSRLEILLKYWNRASSLISCSSSS